MVVAVTMSSLLGLPSNPPEVPASMKKRLGQVGPGMDENHWSHTTNSRASAFITGTCSGEKPVMTRSGVGEPPAA